VLLVLPLAIGGVEQGLKLNQPDVGFMDAMKAMLPFLRVSTIGLMLLLSGNLLFALNIFGLAFVWEISLVKKVITAVTAPLATESEAGSASASLPSSPGFDVTTRRDKEVRT